LINETLIAGFRMRRISKRPANEMRQSVDCIFGPNVKPVATASSGDVVEVEVYDCFANAIRPDRGLKEVLESGEEVFDNPVTGPIYIEGAERGDTLAVDILGIDVGEDAVTALVPGFGALEGWLTEVPPVTKFSEIRDGKVVFVTSKEKSIKISIQPFIGTIGVAPAVESVSTVTPSRHGGNLDTSYVTVGNRLYLRVNVKGALFGLGDVHARQGNGEICGTAAEVPAFVRLRFEVIKGKRIDWPRIESPDAIMTVCSARPLEDAARLAARELMRWLVADFGLEEYEAYMLLSIAGDIEIAQIVNPLYTAVAKIEKELLSQLG